MLGKGCVVTPAAEMQRGFWSHPFLTINRIKMHIMKPVTELLPTTRVGPPTRKPKEDPGQGKKVKNLGLFFYIYSAYSTA